MNRPTPLPARQRVRRAGEHAVLDGEGTGQQQRAFIARAHAQEAHVLLLDEPFTGLDKPSQQTLHRLFRELTAEGRLLIASHHDLQTVPEIFDDILLLKRKQIAFGPVREQFVEAKIKEAYGG